MKYNSYSNPSNEILDNWNNKLPSHTIQIPEKHFNRINEKLNEFKKFIPEGNMKIGYLYL